MIPPDPAKPGPDPTHEETVRSLLDWARRELRGHIAEPVHLDAEWLLARGLGLERSELVRRLDPVASSVATAFREQVQRRATGEPLAHLLGDWEFFGREFEVDASVLVPRPETEHLVEAVLELLPEGRPARGIEFGVGSGCVVITLALERPLTQWIATDASPAALAVARRNVERYRLGDRIVLVEHDLASDAQLPCEPGTIDVLVSNPPYIAPDDPELAPDVARFEPSAALIDRWDGDGLGAYRRLRRWCDTLLTPIGVACFEVGNGQAPDVCALFEAASYSTEKRRDLAGIERVVVVRR